MSRLLARFADTLVRRRNVLFGQVSCWIVLALAARACWNVTAAGGGPYGTPGSLLGLLSPETARSAAALIVGRWIFFVSAALWAGHLAIPVSSWAAVLSFTLAESVGFEHMPGGADHTQQIYVWLLFVYALWFQLYRSDMQAARQERRYFASDLCPEWVPWLCAFSLAWLHTLAGLAKLLASGLGWVNGTSLQIWVRLWGAPDFWLTHLILGSRPFATVAQGGVLAIELFAIASLLNRHVRTAWGILLIAFHVLNEAVFGFEFLHFVPLIALYFLPVQDWVDRVWRPAAATESATAEAPA